MNLDPRIISFTAGKGGCGKTTVSCNFAYVATTMGMRVLLIDCDLANRGATSLISKETSQINLTLTSNHLLEGHYSEKWQDKMSAIGGGSLYFIPSPSINTNRLGGEYSDSLLQRFRENIIELAKSLEIDLVVLDCFSGVDVFTTTAVLSSDQCILVNEPNLVTYSGTIYLHQHLNKYKQLTDSKSEFYCIVNHVTGYHKVGELDYTYRNNLEKLFDKKIISYIPENHLIRENYSRVGIISKFLPSSLFTKKLKLLLKYMMRCDNLFPSNKKELWFRFLENKIHSEMVDKIAPDQKYILHKFLNFPIFLGIVFIFYFLSTLQETISFYTAVIILLIIVASVLCIFLKTFLSALYLSIQSDFLQVIFYARLSATNLDPVYRAKSVIYFLSRLFRGLFLLSALCGLFYFLLNVGNNASSQHLKGNDLHSGVSKIVFDLSDSGLLPILDVQNARVKGVSISEPFTSSSQSVFESCTFSFEYWNVFFNNEVNRNTLQFSMSGILIECNISGGQHRGRKVLGYDPKRNGRTKGGYIDGIVYNINKSKLIDCRIGFNGKNNIILESCYVKNLKSDYWQGYGGKLVEIASEVYSERRFLDTSSFIAKNTTFESSNGVILFDENINNINVINHSNKKLLVIVVGQTSKEDINITGNVLLFHEDEFLTKSNDLSSSLDEFFETNRFILPNGQAFSIQY
ncbi:MAG: AAA family ATPase [Verrucomicrobiota bacterium]